MFLTGVLVCFAKPITCHAKIPSAPWNQPGTSLSRFFILDIKTDGSIFCFIWISKHHIISRCCTCHDNCDVVACAKLCSDQDNNKEYKSLGNCWKIVSSVVKESWGRLLFLIKCQNYDKIELWLNLRLKCCLESWQAGQQWHHRMLAVSYISQESWGFCLLLLCSFMMCASNQIHYDLMVVFVCLPKALPHYDISEGIELLKCLSGAFCLECMSKMKSVLSVIFHAIYGAVRIQLTRFSYDDCENMCTWSYYHHQIGSMTHLPLFRVRSWNNGMCCMSFYILIIG